MFKFDLLEDGCLSHEGGGGGGGGLGGCHSRHNSNQWVFTRYRTPYLVMVPQLPEFKDGIPTTHTLGLSDLSMHLGSNKNE